jgi:hypothetical protein
LRVGRGDEATPTARLVVSEAADRHLRLHRDETLAAIRGISTHHADGQLLGDELRDGEERGNGLERATPIVLVEPCTDDTQASVSQTPTISGPRNWTSSMPTTCVPGTTFASRSPAESTGTETSRCDEWETICSCEYRWSSRGLKI